jgi:DNA-binding GntR family transcriptional regulator
VRPLSQEDALDIFDLRLRLEPEATVLGARAATQGDQATASAAFQALDKALQKNSATVARHNRAFHIALVRPSARIITIETVERLLALSERYVRVHLGGAQGRTDRARREHENLFDAWLSRREDALRTLVMKHVASTLSDLTVQLRAQDR